ncbi:ribokinase [Paenibacillus agricola]|uniref:Ribokinase n=1 Tax=Paenibacillus agricola TaxID=2716264 RepID=A0ABX0J907_9BACL|nr:ribokinase [Paenibacillus agricola]NHN32849.1 ribokinase [Paenibacillus agricola]
MTQTQQTQQTDIIVYGSLNMDFVAYVERLPQTGETISTRTLHLIPGGKAANQAVAASRLGSKVTMVGRVGDDDLGAKMKGFLEVDKVDHQYVSLTAGSETGLSLIPVDRAGQNTIITHLGANALLTKQDVDQSGPALKRANIAIVQMEMEQEVGEYIIASAHQHQVKVILNLAPVVPIRLETLQTVDLLVVNETEASQLVNAGVDSIQTSMDAAEKLFDMGINNVVITLGDKGAVLKTHTSLVHYASPIVQAIDTTAAGDCFVGATAHFWTRDRDLESAIQKAIQVAALSVTRIGAQSSLPTMEEYLAFLSSLESDQL